MGKGSWKKWAWGFGAELWVVLRPQGPPLLHGALAGSIGVCRVSHQLSPFPGVLADFTHSLVN